MRKHIISALLAGAMIIPSFVACDNKEIDALTTRVEALEGAWYQTQQDLKNAVVTGATILTATQTDGVWTLVLSDGKTFTVEAPGASEDNKYIQSATLNGRPLDKPFISHEAVMAGGRLVLKMGDQPDKEWGR